MTTPLTSGPDATATAHTPSATGSTSSSGPEHLEATP